MKFAIFKDDMFEEDWIYLIHHLHPPKTGTGMEEVHHCICWSEKGESGISYKVKHVRDGNVIKHILKIEDLDKTPKVVYDHVDNSFKVRIEIVKDEKYAIIFDIESENAKISIFPIASDIDESVVVLRSVAETMPGILKKRNEHFITTINNAIDLATDKVV